jgi:hypothetical protein
MIIFDFADYFRRLREATDSLSESYIRNEKIRYYDALSEKEKQEFQEAFIQYLKSGNISIREQIAIGKQMMIEAGIPIS